MRAPARALCLQQQADSVLLREVNPAHDVSHGQAAPRGCEQHGARSLAALAYQKSGSCREPSRADWVSHDAVRSASLHVWQFASGVQPARGTPVAPAGSARGPGPRAGSSDLRNPGPETVRPLGADPG